MRAQSGCITQMYSGRFRLRRHLDDGVLQRPLLHPGHHLRAARAGGHQPEQYHRPGAALRSRLSGPAREGDRRRQLLGTGHRDPGRLTRLRPRAARWSCWRRTSAKRRPRASRPGGPDDLATPDGKLGCGSAPTSRTREHPGRRTTRQRTSAVDRAELGHPALTPARLGRPRGSDRLVVVQGHVGLLFEDVGLVGLAVADRRGGPPASPGRRGELLVERVGLGNALAGPSRPGDVTSGGSTSASCSARSASGTSLGVAGSVTSSSLGRAVAGRRPSCPVDGHGPADRGAARRRG